MEMSPLGSADRETLKYLAAMGNDDALDRLADLAYEEQDSAGLLDLWGEGYERAGELLTGLAVAARDLIQLQELGDAGVPEAQEAVSAFLRGR
ncbi:hypothetical protein SAMN04515671_0072 [Nakamurella panacisegetis]|uniref:Uncharacterized protein n=1 Tax=Nakamurella panacisegetis TaxID=1090615 RepID=A0A1H0HH44_9ACTN|nr:hypothetical protein [Nakamurella panacisegetis]SDO18515.1 hypothetical protein SAMN04515671_0072 [Nakamurella panacisegetis]